MITTRRRATLTLAIASVAGFMNSLDTQVVTTALPTLRRQLGGDVGGLEWTVNAYSLGFACLLVTAAGLGDRFGRRRVLAIGLLAFSIASAAAGAAPGLGWLVAARALQGAAAAAIVPTSLAVISDAFPVDGRGRAIGIWGAILGIGGTLGPVVGGALLQAFGWRGIFWINVPVGLFAAAAAMLVIRESRGAQNRLDVRGVILVSAGSVTLTWGLIRASSELWTSPAVWGPLAAGLIVLGVFVGVEHRTRFPMMPTSLFRVREFAAANAATLFHYAGVAGAVFFLSQFFQIAQHATPLAAALEFIPWPLPVLLLSPRIGALAERYGNRPFLIAGMALQAAGMAVLALVAAPSTPYLEVVGALVLAGLGLACFLPTISSEIIAFSPRDRTSVAVGVNNSIAQIGVVLGVAVAGTVFSAHGSYLSAADFSRGFVATLWLSAALAAVAALSLLPYNSLRRNSRAAAATSATAPTSDTSTGQSR